jgi:hypothetical protein
VQGTLNIYQARETDTFIAPPVAMNNPPTIDQLQSLMNTTSIFIVPNFATFGDSDVVPCVVFGDGAQPPTGFPNPGATRLWQIALMRQQGGDALGGLLDMSISGDTTSGFAPYLINSLSGDAVIATGDDDFLAGCRNLFPPTAAPPPTTVVPSSLGEKLEFNEIGVIRGLASSDQPKAQQPISPSQIIVAPASKLEKLEFNEIGVIKGSVR